MAKTLAIIFMWTFMDSASLLLTQSYDQNTWNQFWHRLRSSQAHNLRTSCPWDYVRHHDNSFRPQIYSFAKYHCIDLYKSNAGGPVFDSNGQCMPLRTSQSCGSRIIGFYCIQFREIFGSNKRNSEIINRNSSNVLISSTTIDTSTVSTTLPAQSSTLNIKENTENPDEYYTSDNDDKTDGEPEQKEDIPDTNWSGEQQREPLRQFTVPPFLGSFINQPDMPMFSPDLQQKPPRQGSYRNHNPQLGIPPMTRPMSLMDRIRRSLRRPGDIPEEEAENGRQ